MNITFTTTAKTDDEAKALLAAFPFPPSALNRDCENKMANSLATINREQNVVTSSPSTPKRAALEAIIADSKAGEEAHADARQNSGAAPQLEPDPSAQSLRTDGSSTRCVQQIRSRPPQGVSWHSAVRSWSHQSKLVRRFGNEHVRSHRRYVDPHPQCAGHGKTSVTMPASKVRTAIARVLKTKGYRRLQDRGDVTKVAGSKSASSTTLAVR